MRGSAADTSRRLEREIFRHKISRFRILKFQITIWILAVNFVLRNFAPWNLSGKIPCCADKFLHRQILKFLNFKISLFELALQILYFVNAWKILRREILAAKFWNFTKPNFTRQTSAARNFIAELVAAEIDAAAPAKAKLRHKQLR